MVNSNKKKIILYAGIIIGLLLIVGVICIIHKNITNKENESRSETDGYTTNESQVAVQTTDSPTESTKIDESTSPNQTTSDSAASDESQEDLTVPDITAQNAAATSEAAPDKTTSNMTAPNVTAPSVTSADTTKPDETVPASVVSDDTGNGYTSAETLLASMSLEEKVYQMFVVAPEQLTGAGKVTAVNAGTKASLERYPVGGIIYFESNLQSRDQTKTMLADMQAYAMEIEGIPLFMCVDEEGGRVARIGNNAAFGVEKIGAMQTIGSASEAYNAGKTIGSYLAELGFNVDFAPDADVITNNENTVIGDRSFGTDPDKVTELALSYAKGLNEGNVMSTFKHFPGHGSTKGDTHTGFAYTDKTYEQLMESELKPFSAARNNVDMIMAAHISVPEVIGDNTPASLSKVMITDILRKDLSYNGLIITDALNMGAISQNYSAEQAALLAVKAGVDILLMPQNLETAAAGIIQAVGNGEISESRIDESVIRILNAKLKL